MIQRVTNLVVHILSGMSLSTGTYSYLRVTLRLPPQRPLFALHMGLTCGGQIDNRTKDEDLITTQLHTMGGGLFSQCGVILLSFLIRFVTMWDKLEFRHKYNLDLRHKFSPYTTYFVSTCYGPIFHLSPFYFLWTIV